MGQGRGARRDGHALACHRLPPHRVELQFRGRTNELEHMRHGLQALVAGLPTRQLILGEEGIGKSRLLAEALSMPETRQVTIHSGRAAEFENDRPFGVLSDALDLHADAADPEQAAIGRLIAGSRLENHEERRHEAMLRIVALVKRRCGAAPIALVLEDAQWADRYSVMTLIRLVTECADQPLGAFVTRRMLPLRAPIDELTEPGRTLFDRVDLDPLDIEVMALLAHDLLAHDLLGAPPGPRLQHLIACAGGNPRLLIALLTGLRRDAALRFDGDTIETSTDTAPTTMRPAVMSRFRRLSPRCQDVLTVAAIFERPFGVAMLAAIARSSVVDLLGDLREALTAQLLSEVAGVLRFRHELVRMIIYEETPATVRAELHRQIGEVLRASAGSPAVVRHHLLRAGELVNGAAAGSPDAQHGSRLRWELLTSAERQVALLVAGGLSNKQVGAHLHKSARTVETHLAHIFAKLGINSRVALAAAVGRAGYPDRGDRSPAAPGPAAETDLLGKPQTEQHQRTVPQRNGRSQ